MAAEMLVDLISCDVERNRKTRVQRERDFGGKGPLWAQKCLLNM